MLQKTLHGGLLVAALLFCGWFGSPRTTPEEWLTAHGYVPTSPIREVGFRSDACAGGERAYEADARRAPSDEESVQVGCSSVDARVLVCCAQGLRRACTGRELRVACTGSKQRGRKERSEER